VSIKLVPVVLAPVLLVVLVRLGRRALTAFAGGGAAVFLLLWVPILTSRWHAFQEQVLRYDGSGPRQWGLVQFLAWVHLPGVGGFLAGPGRAGVLAVSGLAAATVVWRRPRAVAQAAGLSLVLFLLLAPAFGMQYLAWPLAGAYLIETRAATAYNIAASIFLISVYDRWDDAPPWRWYRATGAPFTSAELALMAVTWVSLAAVAFIGLRPPRQDSRPPARAIPNSISTLRTAQNGPQR